MKDESTTMKTTTKAVWGGIVMMLLGMPAAAQQGVNPCHPNKCTTAAADVAPLGAVTQAQAPAPAQDAAVSRPAADVPAAAVQRHAVSDLANAVSVGTKAKGGRLGLVLRDSGQGFLKAMDAFSTGVNGYESGAAPTSGFWVEAWTPLSWIEQMASNQAKIFKTLTAENITDEMQEDVFRVIVHPDSPSEVTAAGAAGSSSVEHVVLRSEDKKMVIQPISTTPFTEEAANAMGGKIVYQGVMAKFSMADLREVRHANGEFYITVIGAGRENKDFKVKEKHFKSLK